MDGASNTNFQQQKPTCFPALRGKNGPWWRRHWRALTLVAFLMFAGPPAVFEGAARWLPYPTNGQQAKYLSTVVRDRNGRPLAAFTALDGSWCLPNSAEGYGRWLPMAVEAVEDARFRVHSGVDWLAVGAALAQDLVAGRVVRGASTITMQVQRLRQPQPRTLKAKMSEALRARQIELTQNKDQILAEWLERAPFGGNVVGATAAAWRWFGISPASLSLAQAALIAGLPQNPERLRPDRHAAEALVRRDHVLRRMAAVGVIDTQQLTLALQEPLLRALGQLPQADDMGALAVLSDLAADRTGLVNTTLDAVVQRTAAAQLRGGFERLVGSGIDGAALGVLDLTDGSWLALVSIGGPGWQDLTRAERSTGSTLKPFIYASAFAGGIATPSTVVEDDPAGWIGWAPMNYDRAWRGRCSAAEALRDSRNLPAMRLLEQVGVARCAGNMAALGLTGVEAAAQRAGLAMGIGGVEANLRNLATAYAGLASGGKPVNTHLLIKAPSPLVSSTAVLPSTACWQALRALIDNDRTTAVCSAATRFEPAWKTGTSSGHRDAWCVALTPRRCVVVWLGTTRGAGVPALIGGEAAAPIALGVLAAIDPGGASWPVVDMGTATPLIAHLLAAPLVITHPPTGSEVLSDPDAPAASRRLSLECRGGAAGQRWWFVDGTPIGAVAAGETAWWVPTVGAHEVRVVDRSGQAAVTELVVR
jgi:penicillin-binding protein 1C